LARKYFGTDGVRGVVGEFLTPELVERLGRAAATWTGASKVFVGRDTRASGVELEEAFARGVISVGGDAILGGVLPTPAVALLALDLGVVISASHNPPEYNGVKFFDEQGHKLSDRHEEQIEELLAASPGIDQGRIEHVEVATDSYLQHILERFGSDLSGLRIAVDCANGAYSGLAPHAFERCGATVHAIGDEPTGDNINVGCGATDLALLQRTVVDGGYDLGIAFDGDGDRMLAVDEHGEIVDGDQIVAILALDQEVDQVAVTVMTNMGFHALMRERGITVHTTDVGDRYVLEALQREGGLLGGEQSGHIIYLRRARRRPAPLRRPSGPHAERGGGGHAALAAGEGERARRRQGAAGVRPARGRAAERGARRGGPGARPSLRHRAADPRPGGGRKRRSGCKCVC
jgi:phosphoglucosamine mutase